MIAKLSEISAFIIVIVVFLTPEAGKADRACLSSYTYTDETSGHKYKYYSEERDYSAGKTKCQEDGASLPIIHSYEQDKERIKAQVALISDLTVDVWLGLEQTSQFEYQWVDGVNITVDPQTGLLDDAAAYEHFEHNDAGVDLNTDFGSDDRKCLGSDGVDWVFAWYERPCGATVKTLCVCYV